MAKPLTYISIKYKYQKKIIHVSLAIKHKLSGEVKVYAYFHERFSFYCCQIHNTIKPVRLKSVS